MEQSLIRLELEERYRKLSARLSQISSDVRHADRLDPRSNDQAIQLENDEVLEGLDARIRAEMTQIEKTIERIDTGKYGLCESCGKPITLARLEALPYATRCVSCSGD